MKRIYVYFNAFNSKVYYFKNRLTLSLKLLSIQSALTLIILL